MFTPSPQQASFFNWIEQQSGSAVVRAVAGAGKTTTLIHGLSLMKGSVFFGAYNKKIAEEISSRAPKRFGLDISTMHASGFKAWRGFAPNVKVEDKKCRTIFRDACSRNPQYKPFEDAVLSLVSLAKQAAFDVTRPSTPSDWDYLIDHFSIETLEEDVLVIKLAKKVLQASFDSDSELIDFDDMIYAPMIHNVRLPKYDWVLIDECLIGDTPILIGLDGLSMTIKDMYDQKYTGPVISWDPIKGSIISRVTGAKKIPTGKPFVKIVSKRIGYRKDGSRLASITEHVIYGAPTLICTEDHKIWTSQGWVSAGKLQPGMIVKHESLAPRSRSYQAKYAHTKQGRADLADKADGTRFSYTPLAYPVRKGNGHGPTTHEQLLQERLGPNWKLNVIVPTGPRVKGGPPPHYKLDLANIDEHICIEVDGKSHYADDVRIADKKKDAWLEAHGWKVVRIDNQDVIRFTDDILHELIYQCPVDAEILSVEPWENRVHTHVYDIEVEDTHCYFAHGLLVHNCQDTNTARRLLALGMLKPGGRFVGMGDEHQAIYGFTGADSDALELIKTATNAIDLPLTVTYRCPKVVVAEAQKYVSHIEAHESSPEGVLSRIKLAQLVEQVNPGDSVLCRFNAPIIKEAYSLIAKGIPARVEGREIGENLKKLAQRWKSKSFAVLQGHLDKYLEREVAKAEAKEQMHLVASIEDSVACLRIIIDRVLQAKTKGDPVELVCIEIEKIFGEEAAKRKHVLLSTIHKSKGREWKKVFVLQTGPSKWAKLDWEHQQERNLCYVACTRAMHELVLVEMPVAMS